MDVEFTVKTLEIDEHLQDKINEMLAEGWQLVSGTKPVAVYHVQRMKNMPRAQGLLAAGGFGGVKINEDEIFILRNGKLLKAGEENLPENQPRKD
jgi:hypothetical protein